MLIFKTQKQSEKKMKSWSATAKAVCNRKKIVFTSKLDLLKKESSKFHVWNIALYGVRNLGQLGK
jgi:hypothetical protein